jgi:hypothetical protein
VCLDPENGRKSESGTKIRRQEVSGTEKKTRSVKREKSRPGVWNLRRELLGSLEPEERRPWESGTGREKTRGDWNRKREDQGRLEPGERKPGEYGTEREINRRVWNRKREDQGSLELEERRLGETGTGREKTKGVWNRKSEHKENIELTDILQGVLPKNKKNRHGRGI